MGVGWPSIKTAGGCLPYNCPVQGLWVGKAG